MLKVSKLMSKYHIGYQMEDFNAIIKIVVLETEICIIMAAILDLIATRSSYKRRTVPKF